MTTEKENQKPSDSSWQAIKDIVPMAGILTGALFGASVYFGRVYHNRFYSILGVPGGLLKPAFEEYVLVGWKLAAIWLGLILLSLIPISYIFVDMRAQRARWPEYETTRFWKWAETRSRIPVASLHQWTSFVFSVPILGTLIVIFLGISIYVTTGIAESGNLGFLQVGPQAIRDFGGFEKVEVLSNSPILPESFLSQPIRPNTDDVYVYKNLYVATYGNGTYILFSKIDEITCRPTAVYIVYEREISSISLLPWTREVIPSICWNEQNPTLSPTQTVPTPEQGTSIP